MLIVPCKYDDASEYFSNGYVRVKKRWKKGLIPVKNDGKWGVINEKGVLLTPCSFDYTFNIGIDDDGISMANQNGKWGFVNKKGQLITECIYDEVEYFTEDGIAKVKKDGKYGFIDGNDKMVGVVNQQELF